MDKRKWNVWWLIREGWQKYEVSHQENPIECVNLESLMNRLMRESPRQMEGIELVGIRIEEVRG